jgi:hypothetical protein
MALKFVSNGVMGTVAVVLMVTCVNVLQLAPEIFLLQVYTSKCVYFILILETSGLARSPAWYRMPRTPVQRRGRGASQGVKIKET